jgi:threonine/homoserine/homoserine lactone efflux protein
MFDTTTFLLFVLAALGLLLIPGPAVLYIVARSIEQGRRAGVLSAVAVGLGNLTQAIAASLGLSALILSSAVVFTIIKFAGAAYLVYIGVRTLFSRPAKIDGESDASSMKRVASQGFMVALLNPKTALFFLAFLPQFIQPTRGNVAAQTLSLGITFVVLGIVTDSAYAMLSGSLGHWLRNNMKFLRAQRYFSGGIYVALGIGAALSDSR